MIRVTIFLICLTSAFPEEVYDTNYFKLKCTTTFRSSYKGCNTPMYIFPTCVPWQTNNCVYTKSTKTNRKVTLCQEINCQVTFQLHSFIINIVTFYNLGSNFKILENFGNFGILDVLALVLGFMKSLAISTLGGSLGRRLLSLKRPLRKPLFTLGVDVRSRCFWLGLQPMMTFLRVVPVWP